MATDIAAPGIGAIDIVTAARAWIGTPYRHQASLKGVGCDCLGLLRGVWREIHGDEPEAVPPYAPDWTGARGVESLRDGLARHLRPVALDAVHNDIADTEGFAAACAMARDFGFDGKCLIHPGQIAPARAAFAPSPQEIEDARALLAEFEKAGNRHKGAIAFRGRMVERLHAEMARRLLEAP